MIIKGRDSKEAEIKELTSLLSLSLPENKRFLIERELRFLKSGEQGEKDSAYFIDFYYGKSLYWAAIHDLRLEHRGRIAQIDHLIMNRFLHFFILETKNYSYAVKVTERGEFLLSHNGKYIPIESPIEQNKRHQHVLKGVLEHYDILPKRLGFTLTPSIHSYVLLSTSSRFISPSETELDTSMVIKADGLRTAIDKKFGKMNAMTAVATASKYITMESVLEIARRLMAKHKPIKIDYRKKFGISEVPARPEESATLATAPPVNSLSKGQTKVCPECGAPMAVRVAKKGPHANKPFWGCTNYPKCRAIVAYEPE